MRRIIYCSFRKRTKPVSIEGIQKVTLQVEENNFSNLHISTSNCNIAEAVDIIHSTVQNMWYYPNKFFLVQKLLPHDFETTPILTTISCSPWGWLKIALEYSLDRWSTLLFGWFHEYSCLLNLGTRKFVWNLTGSVVVTNSNDLVLIYCILCSWPIFFQGIKCLSSNVFDHCAVTCIAIKE